MISELLKYIDHTILKPEATKNQVETLCNEAINYSFKSVCVNPCRVKQAYSILKDTDVLVCTVIGFPLGATTTQSKCCEAKEAIENGAKEIDMVINIGAIKDNDWKYVENDIKNVVEISKNKADVKVILETCLLNTDEKIKACEICSKAGVAFVKTSTGFSSGGATIEDITLMRSIVGDNIGVKASGGVSSYASVISMMKAGANRIGTSRGIAIIEGSNE